MWTHTPGPIMVRNLKTTFTDLLNWWEPKVFMCTGIFCFSVLWISFFALDPTFYNLWEFIFSTTATIFKLILRIDSLMLSCIVDDFMCIQQSNILNSSLNSSIKESEEKSVLFRKFHIRNTSCALKFSSIQRPYL